MEAQEKIAKDFIEKYKNVCDENDMIKAVKWVEENINLNHLFNKTQVIVDDVGQYAVDEYGRITVYVLDLVPGHYGAYQYEKAAKEFGIEFDEDMDSEWVWGEIYWFADVVAAYINEISPLNGRFFFEHHEADGSFGLFYMVEQEG